MSIISCTSPRPFLGDLPDLERDERAERLLLAAQLLAEQPDELAAPRRRGRRASASNAVAARATAASVSAALGARDAADLLARDRRADDEVAVGDAGLVDAEAFEQVERRRSTVATA